MCIRDRNKSYDPTSHEWYRQADAADGAVIFSDMYQDSCQKMPVITIAKKCKTPETFLAFDIFPEKFRISTNSQELPNASSYYLCDKAGNCLLYTSNHAVEKGDGFKVLYGVEGYLVDDMKQLAENETGQSLDHTCVVFDIETTGFSPIKNKVIEIGAVKVENGKITDKFSTFVNPEVPIPCLLYTSQFHSFTQQSSFPRKSVGVELFNKKCAGILRFHRTNKAGKNRGHRSLSLIHIFGRLRKYLFVPKK